MYCRKCGKLIDNSAVVCPNCGIPTLSGNIQQQQVYRPPVQQEAYRPSVPQQPDSRQYYQQPVQPVKSGVNGFGIAGFILSLFSLILGVYGCVCPILAFVFSLVGTIRSKQYSSCNGLAIAGVVIGAIATLIWGIFFLIVIGAMIFAY